MGKRVDNFIFILISAGILLDHGVSGVGSDEVSVMEGDSITLYTGVQTNQQEKIKWYFNDTRIAQINGDLSDICTDVQCNEGTERFRDRLKLDHHTGSLTITDITNTDSGEYELKIISNNINDNDRTFNVSVHGVPDKMKTKSVKEGESVSFDSGEIRQPNYMMMWYFNGTCIAQITGDLSYCCTDVQCKERFRDRLKLDHQTGSLIIMNTRNTDSGEYQLQIIGSSSIMKSFDVALIDSHVETPVLIQPSGGIIAKAIISVPLLAVVVATLILYRNYKRTRLKSDGESGNLKTEIQRDYQKHLELNSRTTDSGIQQNQQKWK